MSEPPVPMTTASSGSGCTRPYSSLSRIGRPAPMRLDDGLMKPAGRSGPRMMRSGFAELLSAIASTLPGWRTGGSHSTSGTGTRAPRVTAAAIAIRASSPPAMSAATSG